MFSEAFPGAVQLKLNTNLMAAGNGIQYVLLRTQTSIAKCSDPSIPSEVPEI